LGKSEGGENGENSESGENSENSENGENVRFVLFFGINSKSSTLNPKTYDKISKK